MKKKKKITWTYYLGVILMITGLFMDACTINFFDGDGGVVYGGVPFVIGFGIIFWTLLENIWRGY